MKSMLTGSRGGVLVSIPVQNAGNGVARVGDVRGLSVPDVIWTDGEATRALIPTSESARLQFRLGGVREEVYAEVDYADMAGAQRSRLRLYLTRGATADRQSEYTVRGTAVFGLETGALLGYSGDSRVRRNQPAKPPTNPAVE
jgi:hypothetical protein